MVFFARCASLSTVMLGSSPSMTQRLGDVFFQRLQVTCSMLSIYAFIAMHHPAGSGTNSSSSPGTMSKRPVRHSSLACSIRSLDEETKFHQM